MTPIFLLLAWLLLGASVAPTLGAFLAFNDREA